MFQQAARIHFSTWCNVGGGVGVSAHAHGMGCAIDANHTITALHVVNHLKTVYEFPISTRRDGIFKCELVYESASLDIAILRSVARMASKDKPAISVYPKLSAENLLVGSSVGLISTLHLRRPDPTAHTYLGTGTVSMLMLADASTGFRFAISGTVLQSGFSGSPIFRPDGSIVGVLSEKLSFQTDPEDVKSIYTVPLAGPVFPIVSELQSILTG